MAVCRGCGKPIVFVKTLNGRMMPCEPEIRLYWEKPGGKERIVSVYGQVLACELMGDPDEASGIGRVPHWANCEAGEQLRRPGKRPKKEKPLPREQAAERLYEMRRMLG